MPLCWAVLRASTIFFLNMKVMYPIVFECYPSISFADSGDITCSRIAGTPSQVLQCDLIVSNGQHCHCFKAFLEKNQQEKVYLIVVIKVLRRKLSSCTGNFCRVVDFTALTRGDLSTRSTVDSSLLDLFCISSS